MEEEMNKAMIAGEPVCLLGILGILREALRISRRNAKVLVSIMFLVFLALSLLTIGADLALTPVKEDITSKTKLLPEDDPTSPEARETIESILKDIYLLLGLEIVFLASIWVVSLFSLIVTIYTTAAMYTQKELNIRELFSKVGGAWKRPVITCFYITIISVILILTLLISIGVVSITVTGVAFIVLSIMIVILGTLFYLYLAAVWMLSLVISVVEEDFYGLKALGRAEDLIKGRRLQGFVLMLLLSLVNLAVSTTFALKVKEINGRITRFVTGIALLCLVSLLKLIIFVVYTVFYYECKKRHGENVEAEGRLSYAPLISNEV